jgi:hypothetical protein
VLMGAAVAPCLAVHPEFRHYDAPLKVPLLVLRLWPLGSKGMDGMVWLDPFGYSDWVAKFHLNRPAAAHVAQYRVPACSTESSYGRPALQPGQLNLPVKCRSEGSEDGSISASSGCSVAPQ